MQGRKIAAFSAMLACAALLLGGCGAEKAVDKTDKSVKPLIVVGSDNYPPYNYEDVDGRPTGIDVDLATEAFARMGYKAVFSVIDWEAKKELVESGEIVATSVQPLVDEGRTSIEVLVKAIGGETVETWYKDKIDMLDASNVDSYDPALLW